MHIIRKITILIGLIFAASASAQEHRASCPSSKIDIWFAEQPRIIVIDSSDEISLPPHKTSTLIVERDDPAMHSIIWSHSATGGQVTIECSDPTYARIDGPGVIFVIMRKSQLLEVFWGDGSQGTVESVTISK